MWGGGGKEFEMKYLHNHSFAWYRNSNSQISLQKQPHRVLQRCLIHVENYFIKKTMKNSHSICSHQIVRNRIINILRICTNTKSKGINITFDYFYLTRLQILNVKVIEFFSRCIHCICEIIPITANSHVIHCDRTRNEQKEESKYPSANSVFRFSTVSSYSEFTALR